MASGRVPKTERIFCMVLIFREIIYLVMRESCHQSNKMLSISPLFAQMFVSPWIQTLESERELLHSWCRVYTQFLLFSASYA